MATKSKPKPKHKKKPVDNSGIDYDAIFESMDLNHDGRISVHELTHAARLIGLNPTKHEAELMIKDCNPKEKGYVNKAEFRRLLEQQQSAVDDQVKEITDAFRVFDKDNSGTISAEEIRAVLRSCGEDVPDEEIENMLKMVDKDGDGNISIEEFAAVMCDL
ncbi:hypothetical protein ACF0H5_022320 [Mactra antiquata]